MSIYKVTKAVIPVAGLGTRFLPATKAMPKEMLPLIDKPVIQYVVEEAVEAGLQDILMVTGRNKNALENHFDRVAELEMNLELKGDKDRLAKVMASSELANIHYVRQVKLTSLTTRLLFSLVTMSWTLEMSCFQKCLRSTRQLEKTLLL